MTTAIQRKIDSLTQAIADSEAQINAIAVKMGELAESADPADDVRAAEIEALVDESAILVEIMEIDEDTRMSLIDQLGTQQAAAEAPVPIAESQVTPRTKIQNEPPPRHQIHKYGVGASHGAKSGFESVADPIRTDGRLAQEEL